MLMFGALLQACGIKQYLPQGPALSASERAVFDGGPSGVTYTGPARVDFPVLPVQVWGVRYDLDLVLESNHDRYDMHEYARVQTPNGPVWLCKDALSATKLQSIVADLPDLDRWVPELPIERKTFGVEVIDRSDPDWLDLEIRYENLDGEPVVVTYTGKPPQKAQKKRNGSTMGHSAAVLMAALDIPYRNFGKKATLSIDGQDYKIRKLLGLVPLKVVLVQVQAGLSIGELALRGADPGFTVTYGGSVETEWTLEHGGSDVIARQIDPFRTLAYHFARRDGALELEQMTVSQYQVDGPVTTIALDPALPDMRRPFEGRHTSRFVVDVGGSPGQAVGRLEAWWDGEQAKIALIPEDPEWVTDRPMLTTISYGEGQADVSIVRTP